MDPFQNSKTSRPKSIINHKISNFRAKKCVLLYEEFNHSPFEAFEALNNNLKTRDKHFLFFYASLKDQILRACFKVSANIYYRGKSIFKIFGMRPLLINTMQNGFNQTFIEDLIEPEDFYDYKSFLENALHSALLKSNHSVHSEYRKNNVNKDLIYSFVKPIKSNSIAKPLQHVFEKKAFKFSTGRRDEIKSPRSESESSLQLLEYSKGNASIKNEEDESALMKRENEEEHKRDLAHKGIRNECMRLIERYTSQFLFKLEDITSTLNIINQLKSTF